MEISEAIKHFLSPTYKVESISKLHGEIDLNFKIVTCDKESFLLKLTLADRENAFQNKLEKFISDQDNFQGSKLVNTFELILEYRTKTYKAKLFNWVSGKVWDDLKLHREELFTSLGEKAGELTGLLNQFDCNTAHTEMDWDLDQSLWVENYTHLFSDAELSQVLPVIKDFKSELHNYSRLRKSVVHNDLNEHNIIVNSKNHNCISGLIDFGDAIYTQTINDVAIALAYTTMELNHPLKASRALLKGYHKFFPLQVEELDVLYNALRMRYVVSLTKAKINAKQNPDSDYLQISTAKAWNGLKTWNRISPYLAKQHFYQAIAKKDPQLSLLHGELADLRVNLEDMICGGLQALDLSLTSSLQPEDLVLEKQKIWAGGYLEPRLLYTTPAFEKEDLGVVSNRTLHLGVDFWTQSQTAIKAPLSGELVIAYNNNFDKDYGPTVVLKHRTKNNIEFYSLYGHLSKESLSLHKIGDQIDKGSLLAYIGEREENGNWAPHLHFQLMSNLLGNTQNFPGVAFAEELEIWKNICPNPMLIFGYESSFLQSKIANKQELLKERKKVLGQNLSLSYKDPLLIVKGLGTYLYNEFGQRYLDLVNNVAHVGHENPRVVDAIKNQSQLLNTNTRYLHPSILEYADKLLAKFPAHLSRVYFVNSGSEANELALRMTKAFSKNQGILAMRTGYHGNSQGCIDVSSYKFDSKGGKGKPEQTFLAPINDPLRNPLKDTKQEAKNLLKEIPPVSAFIYETILSCGGQIPQEAEYLLDLESNIRKGGGLCIADEVQTGFGRIGSHFWAFEELGLTPDIITLGKPIGNGHPMGAVVCTEEVAERFNNGMEYFNTFGGNPVSCEVGKAVLEEIESKGLQQNALEQGNRLKAKLNKLKLQYPVLKDVRGKGLFLGIEFADNHMTPLPKIAKEISRNLKDLGVLISTDGPYENVLKIKPPISISEIEVLEFVKKFEQVLKVCTSD
jgi:4-aminobutyrate aminotransferase-like enzyme/Ser/Thr protein kinase RdoA (MazF antagonist)